MRKLSAVGIGIASVLMLAGMPAVAEETTEAPATEVETAAPADETATEAPATESAEEDASEEPDVISPAPETEADETEAPSDGTEAPADETDAPADETDALAAETDAPAIDEAAFKAWAEANGWVYKPEENGYMKMLPDITSSATIVKQGGVNFGAIDWDADLQKAAVKEFLKGGTFIGDPAFAQDESGYNYREMYQLATSYNNVPSNTNLEMVLDSDSLHLLGVSEAGTGKTIEFSSNPNVSVSWVRQIRPDEEDTYNYYCSYGVQINGKVVVYTADDLQTEEGQDKLINLFDKYYPTLASTWMAYGGALKDLTDEAQIRETKLAYITNTLSSGAMVVYEIVPDNIVITAPFLMNMVPQMNNAATFTTQQDGDDKYAYDLLLSDDFLDKLVAYKDSFIESEDGKATVEAYYQSPMFQKLDEYAAKMQLPTSLETALETNNAAGLKTQTTYIPE